MGKGKVIGLKAEHAHPLDKYDPTVLATDLATQLQAAINYDRDVATFATRANVDRKKAAELRSLAEKVEERRKNGKPPNASRMDPLDSYDPGALRTQAQQHEQNAANFEQRSAKAAEDAAKERKKSLETQALIREVNKHRKELNKQA